MPQFLKRRFFIQMLYIFLQKDGYQSKSLPHWIKNKNVKRSF